MTNDLVVRFLTLSVTAIVAVVPTWAAADA